MWNKVLFLWFLRGEHDSAWYTMHLKCLICLVVTIGMKRWNKVSWWFSTPILQIHKEKTKPCKICFCLFSIVLFIIISCVGMNSKWLELEFSVSMYMKARRKTMKCLLRIAFLCSCQTVTTLGVWRDQQLAAIENWFCCV